MCDVKFCRLLVLIIEWLYYKVIFSLIKSPEIIFSTVDLPHPLSPFKINTPLSGNTK